MTRNGIAFKPVTLDCRTSVTASGLLPTPTVCGNYNRIGASATSGNGLFTEFKKRYGRFPFPQEVEVMMGYPQGWTDLETP
jgi:hypothetical protein